MRVCIGIHMQIEQKANSACITWIYNDKFKLFLHYIKKGLSQNKNYHEQFQCNIHSVKSSVTFLSSCNLPFILIHDKRYLNNILHKNRSIRTRYIHNAE